MDIQGPNIILNVVQTLCKLLHWDHMVCSLKMILSRRNFVHNKQTSWSTIYDYSNNLETKYQ